jgi:hypothetical protein
MTHLVDDVAPLHVGSETAFSELQTTPFHLAIPDKGKDKKNEHGNEIGWEKIASGGLFFFFFFFHSTMTPPQISPINHPSSKTTRWGSKYSNCY